MHDVHSPASAAKVISVQHPVSSTTTTTTTQLDPIVLVHNLFNACESDNPL